MNPKLLAISNEACIDLAAFIIEKEEEILSAWHAAEQEAIDQETKPKFRLGFTITLDLDADAMETALAWSVKHKVSKNAHIPDPDQPGLGFGNASAGETIEISTPGGKTTGPITLAKFHGAMKELKRRGGAKE